MMRRMTVPQRCGARKRDGAPCEARAVADPETGRSRNGRCRLHGGLSTGPRTAEGRMRIRQAQLERWHGRRRRLMQSEEE